MALFNERASMLEVQNRALIKTARERAEHIDKLERELRDLRRRAEENDQLRRELQVFRHTGETEPLNQALQSLREAVGQADQFERELQQARSELERLTLERDFYSKRALELEDQNRQLTDAATSYSSWGQKRERELTEALKKYSLWGQMLERELAKIDPEGASARRFNPEHES